MYKCVAMHIRRCYVIIFILKLANFLPMFMCEKAWNDIEGF